MYTVRLTSLAADDGRRLLMSYTPGKAVEICVVSLSKLVWPANTQSIVKKLQLGGIPRWCHPGAAFAFYPVDKCIETLQECGPKNALAKKQFRVFLGDVWPLVLAIPERLERHINKRAVRASVKALKETVHATSAAWKTANTGFMIHLDALECELPVETDESPVVF